MMKKTKLLAATVTLLAAAGFAHAADNSTPPPQDNHSVVTAIQQLGNQIESLTKARVKSVNELAYQLDQSFPLSMQLNIKQAAIQNTLERKHNWKADGRLNVPYNLFPPRP